MTLDDLIATLTIKRMEYGGDVPVTLNEDHGDVVSVTTDTKTRSGERVVNVNICGVLHAGGGGGGNGGLYGGGGGGAGVVHTPADSGVQFNLNDKPYKFWLRNDGSTISLMAKGEGGYWGLVAVRDNGTLLAWDGIHDISIQTDDHGAMLGCAGNGRPIMTPDGKTAKSESPDKSSTITADISGKPHKFHLRKYDGGIALMTDGPYFLLRITPDGMIKTFSDVGDESFQRDDDGRLVGSTCDGLPIETPHGEKVENRSTNETGELAFTMGDEIVRFYLEHDEDDEICLRMRVEDDEDDDEGYAVLFIKKDGSMRVVAGNSEDGPLKVDERGYICGSTTEGRIITLPTDVEDETEDDDDGELIEDEDEDDDEDEDEDN